MSISDKSKGIIDSCRFCWMCRHVCPIGNATGLERNTARARALGCSLVVRNAETIDKVINNIFECSLCGACTNNCVTGWDPKVFIQEVKTDAVLQSVIPDYVMQLINNYNNKGNVFGVEMCDCIKDILNTSKTDTLVIFGQDALYKSSTSVKKVVELLNKAKVNFTFDEKSNDTGSAMWFLTGKTEETRTSALNCAKIINSYKTVVVYNPVDLKLILHEYKEWGIDIRARVIGFNEYLLGLISQGVVSVKKSNNEYSLQDNYAYSRDLDDSETGRKLIDAVGINKEMLLIKKEANLAGHLIMNEYMPNVQAQVALNRWINAKNMDCKTLVTENPDEYELLKQTCPDGYRVLSIEEMILENLQ